MKLKFKPASANFRLFLAVLCVGLAAGAGAAALTEVIHLAEFLAFGHTEDEFRVVTEQTSALRRFSALLACGAVATAGWYFLHKFKSFLSVGEMLDGKKPPFWSNLAHAFLQVFAVGLGAPIGKEVAPRELGALLGLYVGLAAANFAQVNLSAVALCGAAAFLAINLNAPFTAFALAAGFCDINLGAYTAITLSVACAVGVRKLLSKQEKKGSL